MSIPMNHRGVRLAFQPLQGLTTRRHQCIDFQSIARSTCDERDRRPYDRTTGGRRPSAHAPVGCGGPPWRRGVSRVLRSLWAPEHRHGLTMRRATWMNLMTISNIKWTYIRKPRLELLHIPAGARDIVHLKCCFSSCEIWNFHDLEQSKQYTWYHVLVDHYRVNGYHQNKTNKNWVYPNTCNSGWWWLVKALFKNDDNCVDCYRQQDRPYL